MLELVDLKTKLTKAEYDAKMDELKPLLGSLQRQIKEAAIPVIIELEGFSGDHRDEIVSELTQVLDARGYSVYSAAKTTQEQKEKPALAFYWKYLPPKGTICIHHQGWYFLKNEYEVGQNSFNSEWNNIKYSTINSFEKTLTDDYYCIIKMFCHISKKRCAKNIEKFKEYIKNLPGDIPTIGELIEGEDYDAYYKAFEQMLMETNTPNAPWRIIPMEDTKTGVVTAFEVIATAMQEALVRYEDRKKRKPIYDYMKDPSVPNILRGIDAYQEMDEVEYRKRLKECKEKLRTLHLALYRKGIGTIIGFEGWDAAGKGGAIRRLTSAFNPLLFEVIPIPAPNAVERQYNHLWRFWNRLPSNGEIDIFDRTWYGRVLVERIEKFAHAWEWQRSYNEMNAMEKQWAEHGYVVQKFWLQIDKDEQLARFQARQEDVNKQWKITDEDWRNRDKWDEYEAAVNEMLYKTNYEYAPWTVVEANNKLYARIKVLETMIARFEKALEK